MGFRSRITGLLTCVTAVVAVVSLRFGRMIFLSMLQRVSGPEPALSRLTTFALWMTHPAVLLPVVLVCFAAVVTSEAIAKTESTRLLIQCAILQILVLLLAVALTGFLISFHIPDVTIR
jgi:hypothetical protein